MIRVILIDGAGPEALPQEQNQAEPASLNGKEPERQIVPEKDVAHTVETAKEQEPSPTPPKCTFSKTVISVDLNRFTASSVTVVECPRCGRTRSLTPVKGVLRFPPTRATQNPDRTTWQALVYHRKNGLGRGRRIKDERREPLPRETFLPLLA
jgi:hypothetical protein